eukprot:scaffold9363_cov75-Skeletonema_marinoi.AAC.10
MEDIFSYSIVRSYTKPYGYEHIFDAADFARAVYSITKQRPRPRVGYQWGYIHKYCFHTCEVNWLDPEPERDSSGYEEYIDDLHEIDRLVDFYTWDFTALLLQRSSIVVGWRRDTTNGMNGRLNGSTV